MSNRHEHFDDFDRQAMTQYFDRSFYLSASPDLHPDCDALLHYHVAGWREGRDPSAAFSTRYYLQLHPDVAAANMNPLLHYALAGALDGRACRRPMDAWRSRLDTLIPPAGRGTFQVMPRGAEMLRWGDLLETIIDKITDGTLVVSVSHDDYATNIGGVQNIIADEQQAADAEGWQYLHLFPSVHQGSFAADCLPHAFIVGVRLGYDLAGYVDMELLIEAIAELRRRGIRIEVVIHHMMAHAPELLAKLVAASGSHRPLVWVHDFFTLCPSYTLLRNDVVFCGGPPSDSPACSVCIYGDERRKHLHRIAAFFEKTRPFILAPSQFSLDAWARMADFPISGAAAVPLARLVPSSSNLRRAAGTPDQPLRIAHLGARVFHKGWPVYEELALRFAGDQRYRFYQLGHAGGLPLPGCIEQVPVNVTRDSRSEMIEAVAEHAIDVVVSWSFWPETFCFAAHEAVVGGAYVIAHDKAGNVPVMLLECGSRRGMVVKTREELFSLFEGLELTSTVAGSRRSRAAMILGSGTIGWLQNNRLSGADERPADAWEAGKHV